MSHLTRAALLAAAVVLAACSAETPVTPKTAPSDRTSHSGYMVASGLHAGETCPEELVGSDECVWVSDV